MPQFGDTHCTIGGCCCCLLLLHSRLPSFQYATRDTQTTYAPFPSIPIRPRRAPPSFSLPPFQSPQAPLPKSAAKERGRTMDAKISLFPFLWKRGNFCSITCSGAFCTAAQYNGGILFNSRLKRRAREGRSFSSVKKRLFEFLTHYSSFPLGSFFALWQLRHSTTLGVKGKSNE